jgi:outer membrane protein TolC
MLGLWGERAQFELPQRLPDLPKAASDLPEVEQQAMAQRLDVQAAKLDTEALAKNLGLTRTTRFINALEFGPARVLEGRKSEPYKRGYEVSLALPLFDWGTARVAKAEALYMQAVYRAAQTAIDARSEVREAYHGYRSSFDIARHYRDEVVPLRKRIAEENQARYNGMIIGVFELLADARAQIASVNSYIESLRDFWIAQADLDMALMGKPSLSAAPGTKMAGAKAAAAH